jgi:hypothetical protein
MRVLFYRARPPPTWSRCLADNAHCRRPLLLGAAINWRLFGFSSSHRLQGELVPELSHIDPRSVALLVMDYQVDPLTGFMTAAQSSDAIACVPDLSRKPRSWRAMTLRTASSASVNEAAIIWPKRPS